MRRCCAYSHRGHRGRKSACEPLRFIRYPNENDADGTVVPIINLLLAPSLRYHIDLIFYMPGNFLIGQRVFVEGLNSIKSIISCFFSFDISCLSPAKYKYVHIQHLLRIIRCKIT